MELVFHYTYLAVYTRLKLEWDQATQAQRLKQAAKAFLNSELLPDVFTVYIDQSSSMERTIIIATLLLPKSLHASSYSIAT